MLLIFLENEVLGKCFKSENEESEVLCTQHWAQCPSGRIHIPSQTCLKRLGQRIGSEPISALNTVPLRRQRKV